jgi:predicted ABC-type ATPase
MRGGGSSVVVLAGPNGAGKSTMAAELLVEVLGVAEFVDADVIARNLPRSATAAITAGRAMLRRLDELGASRRLTRAGYECHQVFLWLPSADLAVARVADRVRLGGHAVPEQTIRRRYRSSLRNFFALYRPLTTTWRMYDNSTQDLRLVASGAGTETRAINDAGLWERIRAEAEDEG